jgi:hypothetical protein
VYQEQLNVYAFIGNMGGEFPVSELSLIDVEPMTDIPSTEFDRVKDDAGSAVFSEAYGLSQKTAAYSEDGGLSLACFLLVRTFFTSSVR